MGETVYVVVCINAYETSVEVYANSEDAGLYWEKAMQSGDYSRVTVTETMVQGKFEGL